MNTSRREVLHIPVDRVQQAAGLQAGSADVLEAQRDALIQTVSSRGLTLPVTMTTCAPYALAGRSRS